MTDVVPFRLRPGQRPRPIGTLRAEIRRLSRETGLSEAEVTRKALAKLREARDTRRGL